ncbi:hypothetical protein LXL04_015377 [Taraxacum kok-saghyz]
MAPKSKSPATRVLWAKNNFIAVLNNSLSTYPEEIQVMVKVLNNSFLKAPLSNTTTDVPEDYIVKAFQTAKWDSNTNIVSFKLHDESDGYISQELFVSALGINDPLPPIKDSVTGLISRVPFESPSNEELKRFMLEIGYSDNPPNVSDIKKAKFPVSWHYAINLIIRCIAGKTGGVDAIFKNHLWLLWGLYYNRNVNVGTIIFADFCKWANSKNKTEVLHARFWALVLSKIYSLKKDLMIDRALDVFKATTLEKYTVNKTCPAEVRKLPQHMLALIGLESDLVKSYLKKSSALLEPGVDVPEMITVAEEEGNEDDDVEVTGSIKGKKMNAPKKEKHESKKSKSTPTQTMDQVFSSPSQKGAGGSDSKLESTGEPHIFDNFDSSIFTKIFHNHTCTSLPHDLKPQDIHSVFNSRIRKTPIGTLSDTSSCVSFIRELENHLGGELSDTRVKSEGKLCGKMCDTRENIKMSESELSERTSYEEEEKKRKEDELAAKAAADAELKRKNEEEEAAKRAAEILKKKLEEDAKKTATATEGEGENSINLFVELSPPSSKHPSKSISTAGFDICLESPRASQAFEDDEVSQPSSVKRKRKVRKPQAYATKSQFRILNNKVNRILSNLLKIQKQTSPTPTAPTPTTNDTVTIQEVQTMLANKTKLITEAIESNSKAIREAVESSSKEISPKINDANKYIQDFSSKLDTFVNKAKSESDYIINKQQANIDELQKQVRELKANVKELELKAVKDKVAKFNDSLGITFTTIFSTLTTEIKDLLKETFDDFKTLIEGLGSDKSVPKGGEGPHAETQNTPLHTEEPQKTPPHTGAGPSGTKEETEEERAERLRQVEIARNEAAARKIQKQLDEQNAKNRADQIAADAEEAQRLHDEEQLLLKNDPEPRERHDMVPNLVVISKITAEEIVPLQSYSPPQSSLYSWDLPIYGHRRQFFMYDPLVQKPGESAEQLNQREIERSNAFYAKFSHHPKHLAVRSKVIGVSKPKIRTFKGSRFVEFIVKRWDESSKVYTSADFPHMNPIDLFNILKAYRKQDGIKETVAIRHHKAFIREFLMVYCFDYGTLDSVIQSTKFSETSIPPPQPNKSVDIFEDKSLGTKKLQNEVCSIDL